MYYMSNNIFPGMEGISMKKLQLLTLSLSFLTSIDAALCGRLEQFVGLGIVDAPQSKRANGPSTLTIKNILDEDLLATKDKYEGINLASNRLSVEGVKEFVKNITKTKYASNFGHMRYLNLTANPVGIEILEACGSLLKNSEFEFLDIRETPAVKDPNFLNFLQTDEYETIVHKIIFISRQDLEHFKDNPNIYNSHKRYFSLNIWGDKKKR